MSDMHNSNISLREDKIFQRKESEIKGISHREKDKMLESNSIFHLSGIRW